MEALIEMLSVPGFIGVVILVGWVCLQAIGELCEVCGKIVPEFMKVRKYFKRRKMEKESQQRLFLEMKQTLDTIHAHCNPEKIADRNAWMDSVNQNVQWTHQQAQSYDDTLATLKELVKENRELTNELFIDNCRTIILAFADKVANKNRLVSREEFRRVEKVYEKYEAFLAKHNIPNGEIDVAHDVIQEAYRIRLQNNSFLENKRYPTDEQ